MKKHVYESKPFNGNGLIDWTETENKTWQILVERQSDIIKNRACREFLEGIDKLNFPKDRVPQLKEVNERLLSFTGWQVERVAAIIQPFEFFTLLSERKFPAATFIRIPEHLDYLQEPDIFHEIFGHTPLLTHPDYARFVYEFGKKALEVSPQDRGRLFRLFWFTIEFGLINTPSGLRAYGSGILSSIGETVYSLTDKNIKQNFDCLNILRTPFRVDIMQPLYFVINNFADLFALLDYDIHSLLEKSKQLGDFDALFEKKNKHRMEVNSTMAC